ncbi:hypothetical protein JB92DRAFT_2875341 [Gautieria morchelliformis]|nr:hypothetical protein JB92DRAFT_2875341 [Gautieria morchelliformis]
MSQADALAVIQVLSDSFALNYASFAGIALLFLDTLLTLPSEISHVWSKTVRLGTILYLLARYMPLALLLVERYDNLSNISAEQPRVSYIWRNCNTINHLSHACSVLSLIGVQGLLLAHTYAVSLQNQRVLGVLGLLILGAIITVVVLRVCVEQLQYH